MKYYELTYLISPDLAEQEIKSLQNSLTDLIQSKGATLSAESDPIKKRLAYQIKKRDWAYLAALNFYLSPEKVNELEAELKARTEILRHILLIKKPGAARASFIRRVRKQSFAPAGAAEHQTTSAQEKVELKEIDKKLEEILGE